MFEFNKACFYRPIGSEVPTPERSESPLRPPPQRCRTYLMQWLTKPSMSSAFFFVERTTLIGFLGSSLQLLIFPILLFLNWELVSLLINVGLPNPFSGVFLLSGYIQDSRPNDPRYQKSWWDLLFLAYYIIFFAFIRQSIFTYIARPLAKYFGLRRLAKIDRFGEQTYAFLYYAVFGAWGYVCSCMCTAFSLLMPNSV